MFTIYLQIKVIYASCNDRIIYIVSICEEPWINTCMEVGSFSQKRRYIQIQTYYLLLFIFLIKSLSRFALFSITTSSITGDYIHPVAPDIWQQLGVLCGIHILSRIFKLILYYDSKHFMNN